MIPSHQSKKDVGTMDGALNPLDRFPEEILQETLRYLDNHSLANFSQTCHWSYDKATPLLWEDVELVDCRKTDESTPDMSDEHDDTPIIRKLLVLASNPWIASHVHTLTHRCHLPPPAIFYELPRINFQGRTLSHDIRTLRLLEMACQNLTSLHTLRIIFGHWNLTRGLLTGLLGNQKVLRYDTSGSRIVVSLAYHRDYFNRSTFGI
jgi:hypothetical protein